MKKLIITVLYLPARRELVRLLLKETVVKSMQRSSPANKHRQNLDDYLKLTPEGTVDFNHFLKDGYYTLGINQYGYHILFKVEYKELTDDLYDTYYWYEEINGNKRLWKEIYIQDLGETKGLIE